MTKKFEDFWEEAMSAEQRSSKVIELFQMFGFTNEGEVLENGNNLFVFVLDPPGVIDAEVLKPLGLDTYRYGANGKFIICDKYSLAYEFAPTAFDMKAEHLYLIIFEGIANAIPAEDVRKWLECVFDISTEENRSEVPKYQLRHFDYGDLVVGEYQ